MVALHYHRHNQKLSKFYKARELVPNLFCFVHSAYSSLSTLFWEDITIKSAEGDPSGPLLFCLTIQQLKPQLTSEFQMFYLNDGTLGGSVENMQHDLQVVESRRGDWAATERMRKTEVICCSQKARESLLFSLPGALIVETKEATQLGSFIGRVSSTLIAVL